MAADAALELKSRNSGAHRRRYGRVAVRCFTSRRLAFGRRYCCYEFAYACIANETTPLCNVKNDTVTQALPPCHLPRRSRPASLLLCVVSINITINIIPTFSRRSESKGDDVDLWRCLRRVAPKLEDLFTELNVNEIHVICRLLALKSLSVGRAL